MLKLRNALFALSIALLPGLLWAEPADFVLNGRADDAVRMLQQQIKSNANAESYNQLCRVYFSLEDWDSAVRNCEKAVQLSPGVAQYHLWLGRAYGEKADSVSILTAYGLARKTAASFERAVQLDPKDWRARRDLAEYYATAPAIVGGGKDKARKLADEISASDPANAAWIRALIATKDKNLGEAELQFKASAAASGNAAGPLLELARFYRDRGRWSDFDRTLQQVFASSKKTPEDLFDAGELLIVSHRNLPQGIETLKNYLAGALSEYGPAFRAHWLIGQAFEHQGDRTGAVQEYKSALALASGYRPAQDSLHNLGG